jgi:DNA-binding Xre family transcriptional regulator
MTIRLRVKEIADAKHISQRELSRRTGIDLKNIQHLFHHPDANITMKTLNRLARALKVEPGTLLEHQPD